EGCDPAAHVLRRRVLLRRRHPGGAARGEGGEPPGSGALRDRRRDPGGVGPHGGVCGEGLMAVGVDRPAEVTPEMEAAAERAESRRGMLIALPAWIYLTLLFAVPFLIVLVYS